MGRVKNLTGLVGGVREGQNIAQNGPRFWLWSPLETPNGVKHPGNGLKSIRGSWGDHLGFISGVLDPFRGLERAPKPKARPILGNIWTLSDPPCQPGQICLVQNGLYRCIGGKLTQDAKNPDILFGYLLKRDDCIKRSYRGQHWVSFSACKWITEYMIS